MATTEVTTVTAPTLGKIETALVKGDLAALTPEERASYYNQVCSSLGLNPLTKPFDYILLNGKLQLYALKSCTEQLRSLNKISLQIVSRLSEDGVHSVVARATTPDGRFDESVGSVFLPSKPDERANAYMRAETKAKRRVTLSICGLGFMDESETDQLPESAMPQKFEPKQIPATTTTTTASASKPLTPRESARLAVKGIVSKSAVLLAHYADKPESGLTDIEADKVIADIKQAGLKISSLTAQQLEGTIFGELAG